MGESIAEKGEQSKAVKVRIESERRVSQKAERDPPPLIYKHPVYGIEKHYRGKSWRVT